ncbi:C-C chemokine receptor type 8-like [Pelodytes ibericus]
MAEVMVNISDDPVESRKGSDSGLQPQEGDHTQNITQDYLKKCFEQQLMAIKQEIENSCSELKKDMREFGKKVKVIEDKVEHLEFEHKEQKDSQKLQQQKTQQLEQKIIDLEDRSRRKNLRIRNIPEKINQELMQEFLMMKTITEEFFPEDEPYTDDYDYNDTSNQPVAICENDNLHLFVSPFIQSVLLTLFCLSFIGNSVILIILTKWEKLNSVTNIFILNLVIADLIFTVSFPFIAVSYASQWIFGEAMCKMTMAFFFTGFQSFVIFITLMTVYQYLTIVHSWSSTSRLRVRYAGFICVFTWGISIVFCIPDIIIYTTINGNSEKIECSTSAEGYTRWWLSLGTYKHFVLFFLLPLVIIIFCYVRIVVKINKCNIRRRDRVLKLIFCIGLFFFLCWSPYNIIMMLMFQEHIGNDCNSDINVQYAFYICQTIVYFHCCINPLLYAFVGTKFRRHLSCPFARNCTPRRVNQQQDFSLRTSLVHGI